MKKWKDRFSWLKIIYFGSEKKILYKVFTGQEEKLKLTPSANLSFINGSTNFKISSLSDHATTDGHTRAIREQENEETVLKKLLDIAHHIAVKGRPFTDFKDQSSCRDFIKAISEFSFQKDIYETLLRVNFIAILCDRTTDTSITEGEVVYVDLF